jgi:hypothetical protein
MALPSTTGTASFKQVLDAVVGTGKRIRAFCHEFREAPAELHQISSKLAMLKVIPEDFRTFLLDFPGQDVLSPDLRQLVWEAVANVQREFATVHDLGQKGTSNADFRLMGTRK